MDIVDMGLSPATSLKQPIMEQAALQAATDRSVLQKVQPLTGETPEQAAGEPLDRARAEKIVQSMQDNVDAKGVKLAFRLLETNGALQVEVQDAGSGKVIRKIPQDEIVKLEKSLKDQARGLKENYV